MAGFLKALAGTISTALAPQAKGLSSVSASARGGWVSLFSSVLEAKAGNWQRNIVESTSSVLAYNAVFACITLIASDIAKLRVKLVEQDEKTLIWTETTNPAYSPVLRKPNPYQNRIQYWECYFLSKLIHGNTYVLKVRDGRGVVVRLYVLDPTTTQVLVGDDGSIWYRLGQDNLSNLKEQVTVPASEIIHDRWNCFFHPLVGLSPLFASALPATQGLNIQKHSSKFFNNGANPGGVLTAPAGISKETAQRLKDHWEANYTGENAGRVAVLGDGLEFKSMTMNAVEAEVIDHLKMTAEMVCSTFHVPPYKIGHGALPTTSNVESLNIEYSAQCLHKLIEDAELCLDEGLEMGPRIGTSFDQDMLLRMDSVSQVTYLDKASGVMTIDEMRARLDLKPAKVGGDTIYLQQQDYSLEALAKRDAQDDPFASANPARAAPAPAKEEPPDAAKQQQRSERVSKQVDAILKRAREHVG